MDNNEKKREKGKKSPSVYVCGWVGWLKPSSPNMKQAEHHAGLCRCIKRRRIPPKTKRKTSLPPSLFCKYNDDNKGAYGAIP